MDIRRAVAAIQFRSESDLKPAANFLTEIAERGLLGTRDALESSSRQAADYFWAAYRLARTDRARVEVLGIGDLFKAIAEASGAPGKGPSVRAAFLKNEWYDTGDEDADTHPGGPVGVMLDFIVRHGRWYDPLPDGK